MISPEDAALLKAWFSVHGDKDVSVEVALSEVTWDTESVGYSLESIHRGIDNFVKEQHDAEGPVPPRP